MTWLNGSTGAGPVLTTRDAETTVTSKTAKRKRRARGKRQI